MQPRNSPSFMEPECRLPCSQGTVTGVYAQPDESNTHPLKQFPKVHLLLSSHLRQRLANYLFSRGLPTKISYFSFPRRVLYALRISSYFILCWTKYFITFLYILNFMTSDTKQEKEPRFLLCPQFLREFNFHLWPSSPDFLRLIKFSNNLLALFLV